MESIKHFFSVFFLMVLAVLAPLSLSSQVRMSHPLQLQWDGVAVDRFGADTLL